MTQYIIDIGAVPDDGQGDPLRTAFDYTNENFNQIFAAGPVLSNIQIGNNTITTTVLNSNLILSPSGIGRIQLNNTLFPRLTNVYDIGTPSLRFNSIYLGTGGIDTTGGITTTGNITANYFIGNGSQLTGIVATTGSEVVNGTSNILIPSAGSNIFVTVNGTSNVVTFADTGMYVAGQISATGNIAGNYILGNGALLTGINVGYGNSNVAAFLPTYTGNLVSLTGPVTTTANVTGGNLRTAGQISATGNITGGNVDTGRVNAGYITTSTTISAVGNISTNAYFIGDGSQLTNLPAGNYSNANVAAFLPTYTGNLVSLTGPVTTTANITGGNLRTTGQVSATGNITGGNVDASRVNANTVTVTTTISAGGNITGNNVIGTTVTGTTVTAIANVVAGNVTTSGQVSATGNIQGGNLNAPGGTVTSAIVSATGRVQGGNLVTTGSITATGNITGGNVDTGNLHAGNVNVDSNVAAQYYFGNGSQLTGIVATGGTSIDYGNSNVKVVSADGNVSVNINNTSNVAVFSATGEYVSGVVSATGNVSGNYFIGNGAFLTGLAASYSNADVANFLPTYTGNLVSLTGPVITTANITGGNILTGGSVSATGNVSGNYILGNGALLTGVITSVANINNGTSNVTVVSSGGNVAVGVGGTSNVAVFATTGEYITGVLSASGNITGGNITTLGQISAAGNIVGNYFFGNGSQLTGVTASAVNANALIGNTLSSNVLYSSLTQVGTLANLSVAGNIAGGNILSDNYYYANGTPVPPGITYTANIAPPTSPAPKVTDQWYDTTNDVLYEYISDGTSTYWVDTNSPAFAGGVVANVAISGNMLPVANVTFNIGNSGAYFNTAFLQTASVAGNVVAGNVRSDTIVASVLANTTAINLQTNGTNALSVDSNQYITTYRRFAASSMPVGSVVQTVMSTSLGGSITNSTSYADITYATVTITPSSATSKILILSTGTTSFTPMALANVTADTQLVRSPGVSLQIQNYGSEIAGGGIGGAGSIAYSYQDSPGTTSAVTYKLQQKISNASSTLTSTNIWLIAMEIAA